jgi:hypothetical protein
MNWELYEVWSVDDTGHEELALTTASLKEARLVRDQMPGAIIRRETPDGDVEEVF